MFGKALSVSVLNQAVSSATNFLLGIYLVRTMAPAEFGLYGVGFATSLFYAGIGNALLLLQMVVQLPEKPPADRPAYAASMFVGVCLFFLATLVLAALIVALGRFCCGFTNEDTGFATAIATASIAYLVKDFFVRHAYAGRREGVALLVNLTVAMVLAALLFVATRLEPELQTTSALLIYSAGNIGGGIIGVVLARLPLRAVRLARVSKDVRSAWHGGVWLVVAAFIVALRTQAYTFIVAALLGPIGVAKMNAARLFVTPITVLMPAVTQLMLPRMAEARVEGGSRGARLSRQFAAVMLGIVLLYSAVVLLGYDKIEKIVLGDKYGSLLGLVAAWCVYTALSTLRNAQETRLIAYKLFRQQVRANSWAALLSVVAVSWLAQVTGEVGAIAGLCLSEIVVIYMLWLAAPAAYRAPADAR